MPHSIKVKELIEVLQKLNGEWILYSNKVANLSILDENYEFIGFIDLLEDIPTEDRIQMNEEGED